MPRAPRIVRQRRRLRAFERRVPDVSVLRPEPPSAGRLGYAGRDTRLPAGTLVPLEPTHIALSTARAAESPVPRDAIPPAFPIRGTGCSPQGERSARSVTLWAAGHSRAVPVHAPRDRPASKLEDAGRGESASVPARVLRGLVYIVDTAKLAAVIALCGLLVLAAAVELTTPGDDVRRLHIRTPTTQQSP